MSAININNVACIGKVKTWVLSNLENLQQRGDSSHLYNLRDFRSQAKLSPRGLLQQQQ